MKLQDTICAMGATLSSLLKNTKDSEKVIEKTRKIEEFLADIEYALVNSDELSFNSNTFKRINTNSHEKYNLTLEEVFKGEGIYVADSFSDCTALEIFNVPFPTEKGQTSYRLVYYDKNMQKQTYPNYTIDSNMFSKKFMKVSKFEDLFVANR